MAKDKQQMVRGAAMIAQNKKARFSYEIVDKYEAGIELKGSEVKALREGGGSIAEAYVVSQANQLYIRGMMIPPYTHAAAYQEDPTRDRRLLLKRLEIDRLTGQVAQKGMTLIPLKVYFNERGFVKVEVALGKGKTSVDKRHTIKERDVKREMDREMKNAR